MTSCVLEQAYATGPSPAPALPPSPHLDHRDHNAAPTDVFVPSNGNQALKKLLALCTWSALVLAGVTARGEESSVASGPSADNSPCCSPCCEFEACECCDCWSNCQRVLGFLPSDHCFDRFISPLSNPFFFEDPRSLTEVRGIFIDNSLPGCRSAAATSRCGPASFADA